MPAGTDKKCAPGQKARKYMHKFRIVKLFCVFISHFHLIFIYLQSILLFLNISRIMPNDRSISPNIIAQSHFVPVIGSTTFMP